MEQRGISFKHLYSMIAKHYMHIETFLARPILTNFVDLNSDHLVVITLVDTVPRVDVWMVDREGRE